MNRLSEIEQTITTRTKEGAALRGEGARLLADTGAPGAAILRWLTDRGATDAEARNLCVEIVKERRVVDVAGADREVLALIDAGKILLQSPSNGFGLAGPDFISIAVAARVRDLKDRGLAGVAYQVRGETWPSWPQPYILTDAGRAELARN